MDTPSATLLRGSPCGVLTGPATLALALVAMLAVAALAAYLPARRAAALDPRVAPRTE